MQFLSENRLNGCQFFGRFGVLKTESEHKFGFPQNLSVAFYNSIVTEARSQRSGGGSFS